MSARKAEIQRKTTETGITVSIVLDGQGHTDIRTGFGLADHMLTLLSFWAGFDARVHCEGDLYVDAHHTVEDVALCFGQALLDALGDRKGIARTGAASVPMDESLAQVCLDLSGRAFLVFNGEELLPPVMAGEEKGLWREFFKSLAAGARMNLHVNMLYGCNGHHLLESACKGVGLALRQAVTLNGQQILSTKGSLD